MSDKSEVYARLERLADDPRTPEAEAETARIAMARLLSRYGDGIIPSSVPVSYRDFRYKTELEVEVIVHVGRFLGLSTWGLSRHRKLKEIRLEGELPLLEIAVDLIEFHTARLAKLVTYFYAGYLIAAMRYDLGPRDESDKPSEADASMIEALRAGMGLGEAEAGLFTAPRLGDGLGGER